VAIMPKTYSNRRLPGAMTLVEILLAMAIMAVVFAAIVPQLRSLQNSWASKRANAASIQNGRVLIDHLTRYLQQAVRITAVSGAGVTDGYIEFEDSDGNTMRYDIAADNYVEFGYVGNLASLAGPVSSLQFTCYDAYDFNTPTTDVNAIRLVKVETNLVNTDSLASDKTFTGQAYLRANANNPDVVKGPPFEFDTKKGKQPALVSINKKQYLCAYAGDKDDGTAIVLTVDKQTWEITKETSFEFDSNKGKSPALSEINSKHYLCAYSGGPEKDHGWAVVLNVDKHGQTWKITKETSFEFETNEAKDPDLSQIDNTHYLCAYSGGPVKDQGWAVVLNVDKQGQTWEITKETPVEFDAMKGKTPVLSQIDNDNYLCAYTGDKDDGTAVVLTVNTGTWQITKQTPFEFDSGKGKTPALSKIDDTHYLCAYSGGPEKDHGWAVVLTVDDETWEITKETPFEFDAKKAKSPALCKVDFLPPGISNRSDYLCVYSGDKDRGQAIILKVNEDTWTITKSNPADIDEVGYYEFEGDKAKLPALCGVDSTHYLCAYSGGPEKDHGWAVVLDVDPPVLP